MKKVLAAIPGVLAALHAVVPLCFLAAVLSGRYLQLNSPLFISITLSVLTVAALVVMFVFRAEYGWANSLALSFALLFSAATQFYFVFHAIKVYDGYDTTAPAVAFAFCTVAMIVMFIKIVDDSWYKAAAGVVTVLFAMAAVAVAVYMLISGSLFGDIRYSDGPSSPDGAYRTFITYRESGLTSDGASYVYAVRTDESGVPFGKLRYTPKRIYEGGRLAYERISIEWTGDGETLFIDGKLCYASKSPEENKAAEESGDPANESSGTDPMDASGAESIGSSAVPQDSSAVPEVSGESEGSDE